MPRPYLPYPPMTLAQAVAHHRAGRLAEAVGLYAEALERDPDNADLLHMMGTAACQLGDADLAIELIGRANRIAPGQSSYLNALGMAYREKRAFGPAIACYMQVLTQDPHNASAFFGMGNAHQGLGQLDAAAAAFRRAISLKPGFYEARFNLANLEKAAGRYQDAIVHYRIVVEQQPDFADAHHNLGSAYYALGQLDEALASFAAALPANLAETHNNIGNIHLDQGQAELALACYQRALRLRPGYADAYNNCGAALRSLGRFDEALAAFQQAITLDGDYLTAHLNLADLLTAQRAFARAALHYERAVGLDPKLARAHVGLGVALGMLNHQDAALASFDAALKWAPNDLGALYNRGVTLGRLDQPAAAETCYRQVLALQPDHVDAHINLSAILMDDGRKVEARTHIDAAYRQQNLFERPAPAGSRSILLLLDAGRGNINLTHLFRDDSNRLYDWIIEYATPAQVATLPAYDLVFNGMGDADVTRDVAAQVNAFLDICNKPVLNPPSQVARTARHALPDLLNGITGMVTPKVWRIADATQWPDDTVNLLPLLIRPVHTHGGAGMVLATTPADLQRCQETQSGPVYAAPFVDFRSADGWYRKYRMIFIDRVPYPYHLAISQHWLVHYVTADMQHEWKLTEERAFLQAPEAVLGQQGMRAMQEIARRLDLDYAGIDFSILPDGRILVFEANATMLAHPEDADRPLAHKNAYVARILDAFESLLARTSGVPSG